MKWSSRSKIFSETTDARVPLGNLVPDIVERIPLEKKRKRRGECPSPSNQSSTLEILGETQRQSAERFSKTHTRRELRVLQLQIAMVADEDGDRPIHVAVANEDLKLVMKLCFLMKQARISLDITNYRHQTPLHLAVILGNIAIIKFFLNIGASVSVRDRNGNSVIHLAVKSNANKAVFRHILSHPQAKNILNIMDHEGYSALHYAVFKENYTAIYFLYSYGANMNAIDGKSGRTGLIHAVLSENVEMIKVLLKCGSCVLKTDYSGRSALDFALQSGKNTIIKLIEDVNNSKELILSDKLNGLCEKEDVEDFCCLKSIEKQKPLPAHTLIHHKNSVTRKNSDFELNLEETCLCMIKPFT